MLTMEQTIDDVQSLPDERSEANSGHNNNNIHALINESVGKEDENTLKECATRNKNKTNPSCGLDDGSQLTTTETNTHDYLTEVVNANEDIRLIAIDSHPITLCSKTVSTKDIRIEDSYQFDPNCGGSLAFKNTPASTSTCLENGTSEDDLTCPEIHYVNKVVAVNVFEEDVASCSVIVEGERDESLDQDDVSTCSNTFTLTRSRKVTDIPNDMVEYFEGAGNDGILRSYGSKLSPTVSVTDVLIRRQFLESEDSDEDDDTLRNYVSTLSAIQSVTDLSTEDYDDDALTVGHSSRHPRVSSKISPVECGSCCQGDMKSVSTTTELSLVDLPDKILAEDAHRPEEVTPTPMLPGHLLSDCKKLERENLIMDSDTKLTSASCTKIDESCEKIEKDVDISSSKVVTNVVPPFKETDVATKSAASCEQSMENSPHVPCKTVSSGTKYGGVSSIINKYNTLLHSCVSPRDKSKLKSVKLPQSIDTGNCNRCANEGFALPCQASTNEAVAFDGVRMTCDKDPGAQFSNQRGDTVIVDSIQEIRGNDGDEKERNPTITIVGGDRESSERGDTSREFGDISLAMSSNQELQYIDLDCEKNTFYNTETSDLVVEDVQDNELHDTSIVTAVEEISETNFVASTVEPRSILLGSTVDSLEEANESMDTDETFSSQEELNGLTPTSPITTDNTETNRIGMMCIDGHEAHNFETKSVIEDSSTADESKKIWQDEIYNEDENVCTIPDLTSDNPGVNTYNGISLPEESLEVIEMKVFCETSSQVAPHDSLKTVKLTAKTHETIDNTQEALDTDDKELIYLDAVSGDLNVSSDASWDQLGSCCNSGNQSCSETQDCIQLYSNEDMKSVESSSIYDDVASGSYHEYQCNKNTSDGQNAKYVSSYCSENDSCSNFFSEEGDHKQSDNQDGYLSAFDVGDDADGLRSAEHLERFDVARDVEIPVNDEHDEYSTDSPFSPTDSSLFSPVEDDFKDCIDDEFEKGYAKSDFLSSTKETKDSHLTDDEFENDAHKSVANECEKQADLDKREDIVSHDIISSLGSVDKEIDNEPTKCVPSGDNTTETKTEQETFTSYGYDAIANQSHSINDKEETTNPTRVIDTVEQVDVREENTKHEENTLDKIILVDESGSQKITTSKTIPDSVDSNGLLNLSSVYNRDNSLREDFHSTNGSSSMENDHDDTTSEQVSTLVATSKASDDSSDTIVSDIEDEETKNACCEEYQVMWKRMKKLKKSIESLHDQVSREKCFVDQEVDKYKNVLEIPPSYDLSLFERKLAEVQRERWLEQQPGNITQEEYWRRLQQADRMCGEEIKQMNVAEEKLRHLTRITDVWMCTNVVLPYYDPPSLDLEMAVVEPPEATQKKVDKLATDVVDAIGPSDLYMTSWLINEADRMKSNHPMSRNATSNVQNRNDLSVDQMLLPPHILEKLEELRDVVKTTFLSEIQISGKWSDDQTIQRSNTRENQNLPVNQLIDLGNETSVPKKIDSNSEYFKTSEDT